jgi:hypothetical protein
MCKAEDAGRADFNWYQERRRTRLSPAGAIIWQVLAGASAPGRPRRLLRMWPKWERLAHALWPTAEIPDSPHGMLQLRLRQYHGKPVFLPDRSIIENGSVIGELHCMNTKFLDFAASGLGPYRACREDLRSLAEWVTYDRAAAEISALHGTTLLAAGAIRLGFSALASRRGLRRRIDRFFMTGLLVLYTSQGTARLAQGTTLSAYPSEIWMTRKRLLELYGDRPGCRQLRMVDCYLRADQPKQDQS